MPGYDRMRLPEAYRALLTLNARGFAWEWVRRNPDFRAIWTSTGEAARRSSAVALAAVHRSARPVINLAQHSLARRWSPWGLTFRGRSRHASDCSAAGRLAAVSRRGRADDRPASALGAIDRRPPLPAGKLGRSRRPHGRAWRDVASDPTTGRAGTATVDSRRVRAGAGQAVWNLSPSRPQP